MPSLSLDRWSARWLSKYFEWSLVILSFICYLVVSGESSFFPLALGVVYVCPGGSSANNLPYSAGPFDCFVYKVGGVAGCVFFLWEVFLDYCVVFFIVSYELCDMGFKVRVVEWDHVDACECVDLCRCLES